MKTLKDMLAEARQVIPEQGPQELKRRIDANEPLVLVDVRDPDEYRDGGTVAGSVLSNGAPFAEALHTQRLDGGVVSHWMMSDGIALDGHLSVTSAHLDRIFGAQRIASTQTTVFGVDSPIGGASNRVRFCLWLATASGEHHDGGHQTACA